MLAALAPLIKEADPLTGDVMWKFRLDFEKVTQERWAFFLETSSDKVVWLEIDIAFDTGSLELIKKLLETSGGGLGSGLLTKGVIDSGYLENHFMPFSNVFLRVNWAGSTMIELLQHLSNLGTSTQASHTRRHELKVTDNWCHIYYSSFSRFRTLFHTGVLSPI
ncbi:hypothetical protein FRB96_007168 [Tulasnella sp. 330]|nr:hypothetical protein FRB96_007168 [Tulasnella sp. 330]